jgi:hypothetical protein
MKGSLLIGSLLLLVLVWTPFAFSGEAAKGPTKSTFVVQ